MVDGTEEQHPLEDTVVPGTAPAVEEPRPRESFLWIIPLLALLAAWLWLSFSGGGFAQRQWLLPALLPAFLALVLGATGALPVMLGRGAILTLSLFALYTAWVWASLLWAGSRNGVWDEGMRTGVYLAVFAVSVAAFRVQRVRRWFPEALLAGSLVLIAVTLVVVGTSTNIPLLFPSNRFAYPTLYPNSAAALFLVPFWPLLWLGVERGKAWWVRGPALAVTVVLMGLAVLTQSRGAMWGFAASAVFVVAVSPARLKILLGMAVVAAAVAWAFPRLNLYWAAGPLQSGGLAVTTLLWSGAGALVAGVVLALVDRVVTPGRRVKAVVGSVLAAAGIVALVWGTVALDRQVGGLSSWVADSWSRLVSEQQILLSDPGATDGGGTSSGAAAKPTRFAVLSLSGRVDAWRVAWEDFEEAPVTGVGAGNFVHSFDLHRRSERAQMLDAHSLWLRVLGDTGAVGFVLFCGVLCVVLGVPLVGRVGAGLRRRRPGSATEGRGLESSRHSLDMMTAAAVVYWLVHGSADWLWVTMSVTWPVIIFMAFLVARADARGETRASVRAGAPVEVPLLHGPRETTGLLRWVWTAVALAVVLSVGASLLGQTLRSTAGPQNDFVGLTAAASRLQPFDPAPYLARVPIYEGEAARLRAASPPVDSAAVTANLALALASNERAVARDPAAWHLHYLAGRSAGRLAAEVAKGGVGTQGEDALRRASRALAGISADEVSRARAANLLGMSPDDLRDVAAAHYAEALARNPLSPPVKAAVAELESGL